MLLIPDEVMPEVYARDVAPALADGAGLFFASGYNVAFGHIDAEGRRSTCCCSRRA